MRVDPEVAAWHYSSPRTSCGLCASNVSFVASVNHLYCMSQSEAPQKIMMVPTSMGLSFPAQLRKLRITLPIDTLASGHTSLVPFECSPNVASGPIGVGPFSIPGSSLAGLRFPRLCRFFSFSVNRRRRIRLFAGEIVPGEPLPNDL